MKQHVHGVVPRFLLAMASSGQVSGLTPVVVEKVDVVDAPGTDLNGRPGRDLLRRVADLAALVSYDLLREIL